MKIILIDYAYVIKNIAPSNRYSKLCKSKVKRVPSKTRFDTKVFLQILANFEISFNQIFIFKQIKYLIS